MRHRFVSLVGTALIIAACGGAGSVPAAPATAAPQATPARVAPSIKFADFGMTRPRVFTVLTIEDDIRLELQIAAREIASG